MITAATITALALLTAPEWCAATIYRDYSLAVTYRALISPDAACLSRGGVLRLRKTGTISRTATIPGGQERFGRVWGWNITATGNGIPAGQLWTLYTWRWQRWTGSNWETLR